MALKPLKVGNEWKEHGWWIKVDATQKPVLWIMSYTVVEGSDDVLVTVFAEETSPSKILVVHIHIVPR
jgi:hypothetical protein